MRTPEMFLNDIPDDWSAEQALAIYEFLGELQQRIWDRYELQLIDLLCPDLDEADSDQLDLFEFNDDLSF